MVNDKPLKGPIPVAATGPAVAMSMNSMNYGQTLTHVILKVGLAILVSSIVFAMLGVGGGFMYVPILLSCGIDFHTAATTSLVMLMLAQVSALFTFFRSGLVDLKLVAVLEFPTMIGAFIGWKGVLFTILCSSFIGSLVGVTLMFISPQADSKYAVPFGPFLSLGAIIYVLWGEVLINWYWGFLRAVAA